MNTAACPGYLNETYANSLEEFGAPVALTASGGWILRRAIADTGCVDAMGVYPLLCCRDWSRLPQDLEALDRDLVSFAAVLDPFGDVSIAADQRLWSVARPFKRHYVADLTAPLDSYVSEHHKYYARQALKRVGVELCDEAVGHLDEWCQLYHELSNRHGVTGLRRFSRASFEKLLATPGLLAFRACADGATVGMNLIMVHREVAYTHLSAFSEEGYRRRAAYAIRWTVLEALRSRARWLDLGGSAGAEDANDGLSAFKRGWSNETRVAWFCGRVCNRGAYDDLVAQFGIEAGERYFPAYRAGEFVAQP